MKEEERPIQEMIARCVSCMVFHHISEETPKGKARIFAEVGAIAGQVEALGLRAGEVDDRVLEPVEAELVARYGREVGGGLCAEFAEAFGGTRNSRESPHSEARVQRP